MSKGGISVIAIDVWPNHRECLPRTCLTVRQYRGIKPRDDVLDDRPSNARVHIRLAVAGVQHAVKGEVVRLREVVPATRERRSDANHLISRGCERGSALCFLAVGLRPDAYDHLDCIL